MGFCSNCGKPLEENAKFCSGCGTPIAAAPIAPAPVEDEVRPAFAEGSLTEEQETTSAAAVPEEPEAAAVSAKVPEEPVTPKDPETAVKDPFAVNSGASPFDRGRKTPAEASGGNDGFASGKSKLSMKWVLLIIGGALVFLMLCGVGITCCAVATHSSLFHQEHYDFGDYNDYDYGDYDYGDYDGDGEYFDGGFFEGEIPQSWAGHYATTKTSVGVTFYNTENAAAGFGGTLVTICRYEQPEDFEALPGYRILAQENGSYYVALFPTDVQYDASDSELSRLYQEMYDDVEDDFLEDLTFLY